MSENVYSLDQPTISHIGWHYTDVPVARPVGNTLCPAGLEALLQMDHVIFKEQIEMLEFFKGFESYPRYRLLDTKSHPVYYALEGDRCCSCECTRSTNPFQMDVYDNRGMEVMQMRRPCRCNATLFCTCCPHEIEVYAPKNYLIGSVKQKYSLFRSQFAVLDESGKELLTISGPICLCHYYLNVEFKVTSVNDTRMIGRITPYWRNLGKDLFPDVDNFGVFFPMDLDVRLKACLIAATFLINFMYFNGLTK